MQATRMGMARLPHRFEFREKVFSMPTALRGREA